MSVSAPSLLRDESSKKLLARMDSLFGFLGVRRSTLWGCCACSTWESNDECALNPPEPYVPQWHAPELLVCTRVDVEPSFSVLSADDSCVPETRRHPITQPDAFDITHAPRLQGGFRDQRLLTPRQRDLRDQLELPMQATYPLPPNAQHTDSNEERQRKLLEIYREFVLDLHTGLFLRQLTSNTSCSEIHCQLSEDMKTLKLAMSSGNIVEFSLLSVCKMHRVVKSGSKWYFAHSVVPDRGGDVEHIVIVEFEQKKLAFAFTELQVAQRFLLCLELVVRSVQQQQKPKWPPASRNDEPSLGLEFCLPRKASVHKQREAVEEVEGDGEEEEEETSE